MNVTEIEFTGIKRPANIKEIGTLPGRGWSRPIEFPIPIRFNGVLCTHFNLSEYGAIRITQASNNGHYSYWSEDSGLPEGIDSTSKGWMIIPWGAPIKMVGCGISVKLYEVEGTVVIDFEVKNKVDSNIKYLYRVEFPVREANIVRCHYYHCVTGYDTYLGIVKNPDNYIDWQLKENQPYMKKAVEFDTSEAEKPVYHNPFTSISTGEWVTKFKDANTWLQIKK